MNHRRYIYINLYTTITAILLCMCSCNEEDNICTLTMNDGTTIDVASTKITYHSEEDFVRGLSSFECNYNFSNKEYINYNVGESYEVNGYDQTFVGSWQIAKFGNWIRNYGLNPDEFYYVATLIYAKYIERPTTGTMIVPQTGLGCSLSEEDNSFSVLSDKETNTAILLTCVRLIGYDKNKSAINLCIPQFTNNNLTWKFLIQSDGWE